jgi:hypothetical protein
LDEVHVSAADRIMYKVYDLINVNTPHGESCNAMWSSQVNLHISQMARGLDGVPFIPHDAVTTTHVIKAAKKQQKDKELIEKRECKSGSCY